MAGNGLSINSVVITIIAIAIGIVMIGSLLAPTAVNVMADLTNVGVVVIVAILGLIIVAVNQYTKK